MKNLVRHLFGNWLLATLKVFKVFYILKKDLSAESARAYPSVVAILFAAVEGGVERAMAAVLADHHNGVLVLQDFLLRNVLS